MICGDIIESARQYDIVDHILDRDNSRRNANVSTTYTGNCVLVKFKDPVEMEYVRLHISDMISKFATIDKIVIGMNIFVYTKTIANITALKDDFVVWNVYSFLYLCI
jgi:hypothetical protein